MNPEKISLNLPAENAYVSVATNAAQVFAEKNGFSGTDAKRISLAMEEAVLHAIEMGYEGVQADINITILSTSSGLEIVLLSTGLPLHSDDLPKYNSQKAIENQDMYGLSFMMVKKIMDRVSFCILDSGDRQLTMVKFFPLNIDDDVVEKNQQELSQNETLTSAIASKQYTIRRAVTEDSENISRLVLRSHGTILFHEQIYYPKQVAAMINSGELVSVVAETDEGQIFGHGGLICHSPGDRVEELSYGFVHPEARSCGIVSEIANFLIKDASERGVYAIHALAVTSHTHSQKAITKFGFKENTLLVATSSAARNWQEKKSAIASRIGNMVLLKYLRQTEECVLYVPVHHQVMVGEIYKNLGAAFQLRHVDEMPEVLNEISDISSELDIIEGWSWVCVQSYGKDIFSRVQTLTSEAISQGLAVVHLSLPLRFPATSCLVSIFESSGYYFAGVDSGEEGQEYIILQYVNLEDPGFEDIRVVEGIGQELKEYVHMCSKSAAKPYDPKNIAFVF